MKKMKKAERYYYMMRHSAKSGFEHFGNWDWTMKAYWDEDETLSTMYGVAKVIKSQNRDLEIDLKLNIISKEKYDSEIAINKQVEKFVNERKRILKEVYR